MPLRIVKGFPALLRLQAPYASPGRLGGRYQARNDSITESDALSGSVSDTLTRAALADARTVSDTPGNTTETLTRALPFSRTQSDDVSSSFSDSITRAALSFARTLSDTLAAITQSFTRSLGFVRTPSDSLAAPSDTVNRGHLSFVRMLLDAFGGSGSPSVVQDASYTTTSSVSSFVITITTSAGNLLQLIIALQAGSVSGIVDSAGNAWASQLAHSRGSAPTQRVEIWQTTASSPGSITSVTVTLNAAQSVAAHFFEILNAHNSAAFDISAAADNGGSPSTALDSGTTAGTSTGNDLIFGVANYNKALSAQAFASGAPDLTYAVDLSNVPTLVTKMQISQRALTSTSTDDFSATISGTDNWSAVVFGVAPATGLSDTLTRAALAFRRTLSDALSAISETVVFIHHYALTLSDTFSALPIQGVWFLREVNSSNTQTDQAFANLSTFISNFALHWSALRGYSVRCWMNAIWDGATLLQTGPTGFFGYALAQARAKGISLAVRIVNGQHTATSIIGNGTFIAALGAQLNAGTAYTSISLGVGGSGISIPAGTWIVIDYAPASGQKISTFAKTSAQVNAGDASIAVLSFKPNNAYGAVNLTTASTNLYLAQGTFFYADTSLTSITQNTRCVLGFWPDGSTNTVFTSQSASLMGQLAAWCRSNNVPLLHGGWYGIGYSELQYPSIIFKQPGASVAVQEQCHIDLYDAVWAAVRPDATLALEFPMSGGGPITGSGQLVDVLSRHIATKNAGNKQWSFVQGNGLGPVASQNWTSPPYADFGQANFTVEAQQEMDAWTPSNGHAMQMINVLNTYNWDWVFSTAFIPHGSSSDPTPATGQGRLVAESCQYVEIYDQSFTAGAGSTWAQLASYLPGGANPWSPFTPGALASDSIAIARGFSRAFSESLTVISDALTGGGARRARAYSDTLTATSDVVSIPARGFVRAISDTWTPVVDLLVRDLHLHSGGSSLTPLIFDTILSSSDAITRAQGLLSRVASDAIAAPSELLLRVVMFPINTADLLDAMSDSIRYGFKKLVTLTVVSRARALVVASRARIVNLRSR